MEKQELIKRLGELNLEIERKIPSTLYIDFRYLEYIYGKINGIMLDFRDSEQKSNTYIENNIQFCGNCHQKISLRRKRIDKGMVSALIKVFNYVIINNKQTFKIKNIGLNPIEYGSLNHLVRFGLLYKQDGFGQGEYGIPRRTASRFLSGEWSVAEYYETDPTKKEGEEGRRFMSEKRITINEIPSIGDLKKQFGEKLVEYEWNENFE